MIYAYSHDLNKPIELPKSSRGLDKPGGRFSCIGRDPLNQPCKAEVVLCAWGSAKKRAYFRVIGNGHIEGCDEGATYIPTRTRGIPTGEPNGQQAPTNADIKWVLIDEDDETPPVEPIDTTRVDPRKPASPRSPRTTGSSRTSTITRSRRLTRLLDNVLREVITYGKLITVDGHPVPLVEGWQLAQHAEGTEVIACGTIASVNVSIGKKTGFINFAHPNAKVAPGITLPTSALEHMGMSTQDLEEKADGKHSVIAYGTVRHHKGRSGANLVFPLGKPIRIAFAPNPTDK